MRKFIHIRVMLITSFAVLLTALLSTFAYYRVFRDETFETLASYTRLLSESSLLDDESRLAVYTHSLDNEHIRITIIDPLGNVIFDNMTPVQDLGSHLDRPEVADALKSGVGSSVRRSDTVRRTIFYYALRLSDGNILRTARLADNSYIIFFHAIPIVAVIALLMIFMSYPFARILTRNLLAPISAVSMQMETPHAIMEAPDISTYPELEPIITHIVRQHQNIIDNARLRQEFTANVSHELKTPLTSISGYAQLIESGIAAPEDAGKFITEIRKNADRLLTLINDILRLSELDAMKEPHLNKEEVDLYQAALTCASMLEDTAERHDVAITVQGSSCSIMADRIMIDELIYNLCDNAIRYNRPGGHVNITVSPYTLTVADDGIGIPKKYHDRIFERFFRVDKSRSKKTGGTGLGLAIVKHIVEHHHAALSVESETGKGTTIVVRFPEEDQQQ